MQVVSNEISQPGEDRLCIKREHTVFPHCGYESEFLQFSAMNIGIFENI